MSADMCGAGDRGISSLHLGFQHVAAAIEGVSGMVIDDRPGDSTSIRVRRIPGWGQRLRGGPISHWGMDCSRDRRDWLVVLLDQSFDQMDQGSARPRESLTSSERESLG
jgi:hypothetical protein